MENKIIYWRAVALFSFICLLAKEAYAGDEYLKNDIVFIGMPHSVSTSDLDCNIFLEKDQKQSEFITTCMNEVLAIGYRSSEIFLGDKNQEIINFYDTHHGFAFPKYLSNSYSYIHLKKINGNYLVIDVAKVVSDPKKNQDLICAQSLKIETSIGKNFHFEKFHGKKYDIDDCEYAIRVEEVRGAIKER